MRLALIVVLASTGCGSEDSDGGDADADVDADADSDSDADVDADADTDCSDRDADGFTAMICDGGDCDDDDAAVRPGAPDGADFAWHAETIEGIDADPSLAVDANGVAHVAYVSFFGAVRYATNASGIWRAETVDPDASQTAEIAIAPDGAIHVVYPVGAWQEVRHATTETGAWTVDTIETGVSVTGVGIAFAPDGTLHVAYTDWNADEIRHAVRNGDTFDVDTVAPSDISLSDELSRIPLAVDSAGDVHLMYIALGRDMIHAVNDGSGWNLEPMYTDAVPSMLVVDADDVLHLSFALTGIEYVTRAGAAWGEPEVVSPGYDLKPALGVAADGTIYVAYTASEGVEVATRSGGEWSSEIVPGVFAGLGARSSFLDVDDDGGVHLAFWCNEVDFARRIPPDGVDQNCDGVDGLDSDGDGFAAVDTGGDDCDDTAAGAHPGADDPPGDGIDQNCDGIGGA